MQITAHIVTVPAGDYYLGDPCYAVNQDDWSPLLASCEIFEQPVGTLPDGTKVLAFGTKYGDGQYDDNKGNSYGVDAGLIGLVPVNEASTKALGEYARCPSTKVTFDRPVECKTDDGKLIFGDYVIDTDPNDEEDDDLWYR